MASSLTKLDQALIDLLDAYVEVREGLAEKFGDDEDTLQTSVVESLETAIEAVLDEQGSSTNEFAAMLSSFSEALEQLDPSAFEDDEGDLEYDLSNADMDYDDDDDMDIDDDEEIDE